MDSHRTPPHSIAAEEALLGAVLLSRVAIESVADTVVPGDFYGPGNGLIFEAVMALYRQGDPADVVTVTDRLKDAGVLDEAGGTIRLLDLQAGTPSTSNALTYAKTVAGHAVLRRVIAVALEASDAAYDPTADPDKVVKEAQEGFSEALSGVMAATPKDLWILDEFLERPIEDRPGWVVPGMLRHQWRAMVVAGEGSGKTVLFRQIGIAAGQGVHPLHFQNIDPVRVLIVDLENPDDSVVDVCAPLRDTAKSRVGDLYESDRVWLWHRPGGINLRQRRDRMELETVVAQSRPDLVCLGPIYKSYTLSSSESDELAAKEVMQCFDDLRTRYGFALLLEHHAPKGGGSKRDMTPYGTSLWLRWPELGISLSPIDAEGERMRVGRWRGDRLENSWPIELRRGQPWLWKGLWPDGTFRAPGEPPLPTVGRVDDESPSSEPIVEPIVEPDGYDFFDEEEPY